jgi:hypothetical protein
VTVLGARPSSRPASAIETSSGSGAVSEPSQAPKASESQNIALPTTETGSGWPLVARSAQSFFMA